MYVAGALVLACISCLVADLLSKLLQCFLDFFEINVIGTALHHDKHTSFEKADSSSEHQNGKNESADRITVPPSRLEVNNHGGYDDSKRTEEITYNVKNSAFHIHVTTGFSFSFTSMAVAVIITASCSVDVSMSTATA
jgi:hypothetical protein